MVIELLGPSIQDLFKFGGFAFPKRTLTVLAIQMIQRVKYLHEKGYIHRDLKPDNFLIGSGKKQTTVYLVDYGLAKECIQPGKHDLAKDEGKFVGAARYASFSAHLKKTQGRKDDLESLGFILVYLYKGMLPWQGITLKKGEELEEVIYRKKIEMGLEGLCKGLPEELRKYFEYCKGLEFITIPGYNYLIGLFTSELKKLEGDSCNLTLDWTSLKKVFHL